MTERICPYCGQPAADTDAEIAHMEAAHPSVISDRLGYLSGHWPSTDANVEEDRLAKALYDWKAEMRPNHGPPYEELIEPTKADLRGLARRLNAVLEDAPPEHDSTGTTPAYGSTPLGRMSHEAWRRAIGSENRVRVAPLMGHLLYDAMRSVDPWAQPPWEEITVQLATDMEAIAVRFGVLSNGLICDAVAVIEGVANFGDERSAKIAREWLVEHGIYEPPADDKE